MIEQRSLSLISNRTHQSGGRRIPESVIERDYCLSWFLFGLAQSPLKEAMIFKGGTALRRCYFQDYRFSEDLDFTLAREVSLSDLLEGLKNNFSYIREESGIVFDHVRQEPSTENTHTIYLSYSGPIPGRPKEVKTDITFREKILTPVEERKIIQTYDEYSDFHSDLAVKIYSLEEVAIEKTCALLTPARNEPRDLFDIHYLFSEAGVELEPLVSQIDEKLKFKGSSLQERKGEFQNKEKRLEKSWETRLAVQMSILPEFQSIYRAVKKNFREAELL